MNILKNITFLIYINLLFTFKSNASPSAYTSLFINSHFLNNPNNTKIDNLLFDNHNMTENNKKKSKSYSKLLEILFIIL